MKDCQIVFVALVTPMRGHLIDFEAFERLINFHCEQKTDALVILGTTGECVTITDDERTKLIQVALRVSGNRISIWVGTGTNCTAKSIAYTRQAAELGASGCMVVTPYYNKPTQKGIISHFSQICGASDLPVMLYDVPSRTQCKLTCETLKALHQLPSIVAYKDATGDLSRVAFCKEHCPKWRLLCGADTLNSAFIFAGGHGVVSVLANCIPHLMKQMITCIQSKEYAAGYEYEARLYPLVQFLDKETNPIVIKWILYQLGKLDVGIRLPLLWLDDSHAIRGNQVIELLNQLEQENV
jgi:4-hydroxy-tetrahydrodipicolinate synthase